MTTIETTGQAETLPVGTVLRLTSGQIYARIDTADDGADWQTIGDTYCWGAAEMLNEHPGPATVLHDPTQPAPVCDHEALVRTIVRTSEQTGTSVATLIRAAEAMVPAPAGVIDRDTMAKAIEDRIKASPILPEVPGRIGQPLAATMHDLADAVLAVLPGRTVAQVKAEALREAAAEFDFTTIVADLWLLARADELEREDKR